MSTEPLPTLPFVIDGLKNVLAWMAGQAADLRAKYPDLPEPPAEFRDAALPKLLEAVGDPLYAEKVLLRAWQGISSGEAGFNRHHVGLSR